MNDMTVTLTIDAEAIDAVRAAVAQMMRQLDELPHRRLIATRRHTWEIDTVNLGLNDWLTLVYDHDDDAVLDEYPTSEPPTSDALIDMVGDTLAQRPLPARLIISGARDRLGRIADAVRVYGVQPLYGAPLSENRRALARIFKTRRRTEKIGAE